MTNPKAKLNQLATQKAKELFPLAKSIFDEAESDGKEYNSARMICDLLDELNFDVERGVGGLETAFRAVWDNGEGPNIGFLVEYDAVREKGHICGHHLQAPAGIAAALSLIEVLKDRPYKITIYGTPAEETFGGKIVMLDNGCFHELDIALATHAAGTRYYIGGDSLAMVSHTVRFQGSSSHAAGAPWLGRSALDAMILTFTGVEFLREHIHPTSRLHYTVREGTGPSNAVPSEALASVTLRSMDNKDLEDMERRFELVIKGATMMTETTAEISKGLKYLARFTPASFAEEGYRVMKEAGIEEPERELQFPGGSTDFGNVSTVVPSALFYVAYCDAASHSIEWYEAGKTPEALRCLEDSGKILAGMAYDLIKDSTLLERIKREFREFMVSSNHGGSSEN
jgi:aminobenzoyl-glutamate utilization protein B